TGYRSVKFRDGPAIAVYLSDTRCILSDTKLSLRAVPALKARAGDVPVRQTFTVIAAVSGPHRSFRFTDCFNSTVKVDRAREKKPCPQRRAKRCSVYQLTSKFSS